MTYDWMIVGAGFAGSALAERLANDGVLFHEYGPHLFHTNSTAIIAYLSRFTSWCPYQHRVLASVDAQLVPLPINLDTVNQLNGLSLDGPALEAFFDARKDQREPITTSEDLIVGRVGTELYQKFFRNYTRKQRALDPSELSSSQVFSRPGTHTESSPVDPGSELGTAQARGESRLAELFPGALVIRCGSILGLDRRDDALSLGLDTLASGRRWTVPLRSEAILAPDLVEAALDLLIDDETGIWHLGHGRTLLQLVRSAAHLAGLPAERLESETRVSRPLLATERVSVVAPRSLRALVPRSHAQLSSSRPDRMEVTS